MPTYNAFTIPAGCPFTVAPPTSPAGPTVTLTQDLPSYRMASNMTLDLNGFRVGTLQWANDTSRMRVTNGRLGIMTMALGRSSTDPTRVNDVIIDNVTFVGGVGTHDGAGNIRDGNGLRIGRLLMTNCKSIAGSAPTVADGLHTCAMWLDPGSHDVVIQYCNLATRGLEACLRFESTKRTVVHHSTLACSGQKHAYRVHGNVGPELEPSQDNWISDVQCINRGIMIGTLPDSTGPQVDIVRRAYVRDVSIIMLMNGDGQDAAFQLPTARLPDGRYHLVGARVENLSIKSASNYNPLPTLIQAANSNPALQWQLVNCTFSH